MRFNQVFFSAILAIAAHAQDNAAPTDEQKKECIAKCDPGNVVCLAHCPGFVPSPTEEDIAKLTDCSAACEQGDGSPGATDAYAKCLTDCRDKYFYANGVGTPNQGFGDSSNSTSNDSGSSESGKDGDSKNSTSSDSKGNDSKGNGAATLIGSSLLGVVAAMLAL